MGRSVFYGGILFLYALFSVSIFLYIAIYNSLLARPLRTGRPLRLALLPPYRMVVRTVCIYSLLLLALSLICTASLHDLHTPADLEAEILAALPQDTEWEVTVAAQDGLAVVLAWGEDPQQNAFAIYRKEPGLPPSYEFRYGGSGTDSIRQAARLFSYKRRQLLLSLNVPGVARIVQQDGTVQEVDPDRPFALVLPSGSFTVWDADGRPLDLAADPAYEFTPLP